ncbi:unnamed protein product [Gemmata massiliana]|uniref:Uncharacterized protein n=1 Tax=Gemmata massiliana TaxID=1210884 RepID=A0A6P2CWV7_9BACT|nr:hypothetical protein [Gemmata massiliana]VTR92204.1 unnamed protein product [Gemmata massiliana]
MAKRMRYLFVGGVGLALAVLGYDQMFKLRWGGFTELTVEFVVTDAETGLPVEGAEVFVADESYSAANVEILEPQFKTNREGVAVAQFPSQRCGGDLSRLGFTNTRSVLLPEIRFWCKGAGLRQSDVLYLNDQPHRRSIQHTGPGQDRLIVSVALCKSQP